MGKRLTRPEAALVEEALETALTELRELRYSKDWFSSDAEDLLVSALEIMKGSDETTN